jgi:hypothetical protein
MYDKFCYQSSQYTITCLSQFDCTHLQIDRTDHIGVHIIPASLVIPAQAVIHLPATFGRPRRGETRNLLVRSQYVILPALPICAVYFFIPALLVIPAHAGIHLSAPFAIPHLPVIPAKAGIHLFAPFVKPS